VRAIELFLNRDNVKQIQVVFMPEDVEDAKKRHGAHLSFSGVKVLSGGPRWMDQVAAAKENISPDVSHVVLHDAARPSVPYTDVDAILEAAESAKKASVVLTSPVRSTLIELDPSSNPLTYHLAQSFVQLLYPQAFTRDRFLQMATTKTEVPPYEIELLKGSPLNVRLGGPGDVNLAKAMINMLPKRKVQASSPFEEAQW
jgi:2-C-methyl-D-erythritol 4-phosphate cytidylyltransferase